MIIKTMNDIDTKTREPRLKFFGGTRDPTAMAISTEMFFSK